jgi:hypothetical protein
MCMMKACRYVIHRLELSLAARQSNVNDVLRIRTLSLETQRQVGVVDV